MTKQKLELTWIGKDKRPKLEPRILLEDPDKSYHAAQRVSEDDQFDNKLIFGDNLLALRALETEYAGKVKCIFIDPPFNTKQAFEHYDDGLEHSLWLSLMKERVTYLHNLLNEHGTLFVHIDDNELGYLMLVIDEVFGRDNRVSIVTFKQGAATGHKAINPGLVTTTNYLLVYVKDKRKWEPNRLFTARERDSRYSQFIDFYEDGYENWQLKPLNQAFAESIGVSVKELKKVLSNKYEEKITLFVEEHAHKVVRPARPDYQSVGNNVKEAIDVSKNKPDSIIYLHRDGYEDMYFRNGQRLLFYKNKLKNVDGKLVSGEPLTNLWDDLLSNNLHKEGGVKFPKGKKPEALIKRAIELSTNKGDWVLDSFAGSGTTGAAAHKMGRKWIMIELGNHCDTHILPRMKRVIDGVDQDGISKTVDWKGGGGFRYYKLAPSLLKKDQWDNWIINKEYNAEMLAEALCKLHGFHFSPSLTETNWWQHGYSTESDFIYVTTQTLSVDYITKIAAEVGENRSLLICCSAFKGQKDAFPNITLKKIPQSVLHQCEWDNDDYSLNVENLPQMKREPKQGDLF